MELESIKRQLAYLENGDVKITKLVTDRHVQVTSYMAKEKPEIEHVYDVWHVAKGAANSQFASINHSNISASVVNKITGIVNHVIK